MMSETCQVRRGLPNGGSHCAGARRNVLVYSSPAVATQEVAQELKTRDQSKGTTSHQLPDAERCKSPNGIDQGSRESVATGGDRPIGAELPQLAQWNHVSLCRLSQRLVSRVISSISRIRDIPLFCSVRGQTTTEFFLSVINQRRGFYLISSHYGGVIPYSYSVVDIFGVYIFYKVMNSLSSSLSLSLSRFLTLSLVLHVLLQILQSST